MEILLFGDQAVDYRSFLTKLLLVQDSPLLSKFLQHTQDVLRHEISQLPAEYRKRLPDFSTVQELVERYFKTGFQDASIESALMCITQFAHFICFYEREPQGYVKIDNTQIVGVCAGLLTASAVASCESLPALIPLAIEVVRIAFRLGARVSSNAYRLEETALAQKSWSKVIGGANHLAIKAAIEEFNKTQLSSNLNRVYISSTASNSMTISGPPSMLQRLLADPNFPRGTSQRDLPIFGPYHASHLYFDSGDIIVENTMMVMNNYRPVHQVCSLKKIDSPTVLDLFEQSIIQILSEPIYWQETIDTSSSGIRELAPASCRILSMGPTTFANGLASSLKALGNGIALKLEDPVSWMSSNETRSQKNLPGCNIAIVGMSGRFPDAANLELFWELLEKGLDVHREIPPDRFDAKAHTDESGKGKNKSHTPYGCFIENPGLFDPRFFSMSPREAAQTDPMQRLAITTAYEAMESSGFVVNRTPSSMAHRVGTFYGQTSDDWREINAAQDIDTYFITGGVRAFGPGRVNYHFGFSGPSFNVDTACSSSFAAIQLACTSLRANECDTAFTGGMNVLTNPDIFSGLSKGQFLSSTGSCKTYDSNADGYCRGDGVVTLILKRVEDAITDKDPILGVIRGTATNHSAEAVSITHPHVGAQQFLFQKIVDDVGVDARDISYVEMHGTGTQAGDGVEMESVTSVFAPRERRRSNKPLFVGSAKANIGHGEAASGACALVKVLLMLQKDTIPPHCGIKGTINPVFPKDLAERGVHIAFEPTKFPRPLGGTGKRYCFINNFSAAGGNTGMLLEDAPLSAVSGVDSRPSHVVLVSAKSLASFKKNIRQLLSWTERHPEASMGSLAYTTSARRYHYNYRIAFVASDMDRLRSLLSDSADTSRVPVPSTPPKVAFTFTGQGSQYSGMAKALYEDSPYFRQCIESLCNLAYSQGFPSASILGLVNGSVKDVKSESPVAVQLAITIVQIALARFWQSLGVTPSVVIGHSLGEYAALHIAGVLSASDTISAVGKRAQLLVSCCTSNTHGMLAVRCHVSRIEDLVGKLPVEIACINAPEETVLSGETDVINELDKVLANKGIRCTKLNTPFAFHSSQVSPILESFKEATRTVVFHSPKLPIISPLLSEVIRPGGASTITPKYLASHCRDTVNFVGSLNTALLEGVIDENMVWVEVGPHPHCLNMIKAVINSEQAITAVPSLIRNENAWKTVSNSLATLYTTGLNLEWPEYFKGFEDAVEVLPIPTYSFDEKVYWLEYKNNWTLTKGEAAPLLPPPVTPSFSTTSVQKIIKEEINGNSVVVVAETDLCEPLIAAAIAGHLLNGVPFCPSTLFADMAFTLCEYAYKLIRPNEEGDKKGYNVCNMESHKAVILDPKAKSQILQISITFDLDKGMAQFQYKTKLSESKLVENGHSIIRIEDKEQWVEENKRRAYLVRSRIASLKTDRGVHTIHRGMAYKLFTALVNYDNKYRAMEEVLLDSHNLEATARIVFQTSEKDGNFIMNPYRLDPACHISGFIVNATDAIDSSTQVYISHGWESMRFTKKLETHKTYRSYVKMAQISSASKVVSGDVYVFEGEGDEDDELIGVVGGLKFQCVPRRLLDILVGSDSSSASARSSPKAPAIDSSKVSKPAKRQTSKTESPDRGLAENKDQDMTSDSDSAHTPTGPSSVSSVESGDDEPAKSNEDATIATIRSTIANEMGVDIEEISDTVDLPTMGMDSLMSLAILGILREQTGLKLGSEFLLENPSMADIKKSLGLDKPRPAPKSTSIATAPEVKKSNGSGMDSLSSYPPAQSLLLQGNPKTASRNLFLLPDGSGSATSYAGIPDLDVETAVFGLNCPFMKTPELFTIEIQHISKIYIAAIKKRQPHGPYMLGGWSAGGVLAYEITRQLIAQGDVVSKLILIDSPNPIKLEALPPSFHQFCDRIGLLGDGSSTTPSWLVPHFRATVNKLTSYSEWLESDEIDTTGFPVTTTIWARDGIVQGDNREQLDWDERVPMPNSMFWLCNSRKDLGHNGWEKLVGKGKMRCVSMKGNHFTMMREPLIKEVARLVKEAMDVE